MLARGGLMALLLAAFGCDSDRLSQVPDAGVEADAAVHSDAAAAEDASAPADSGPPPRDAGPPSDTGASPQDAGAERQDAGASIDASEEMVQVPAGSFWMGCDDCSDTDEAPLHQVTLSAFEIDRTEVTQSAYAACIAAGQCTPPSDNFDPITNPAHPVGNVTWAQAVAFCSWLGKRLPTEAEWEKAARGTDARRYPWGDDPPDCTRANIDGCGDRILPAGIHPTGASPYGALDMAGNLWEMTADWYAENAYADHVAPDPTGPTSGTTRVYRGGSYGNLGILARTSNRASSYNPDVGGSGLGFRCARSL